MPDGQFAGAEYELLEEYDCAGAEYDVDGAEYEELEDDEYEEPELLCIQVPSD